MAAVSAMVFAYGVLWKLSAKSVAWYDFIQDVPVTGSVEVTGGYLEVGVQEPVRVTVDR